MLKRLCLLLSVAGLSLILASPAYSEGYEPVNGYYYSDGDIEAIIEYNFEPGDAEYAKSIAWCESTYSPTAYNPAYDTVGIFQLSAILREEYGLSVYDVDTPEENIYWASVVFYNTGAWPWACA